MQKSNKNPLPALPLLSKVAFTAALGGSILFYGATWGTVLRSIYGSGSGTQSGDSFGVILGMLADTDPEHYRHLLTVHTISMVVLIGVAVILFRMTAMRRRVKVAFVIGVLIFSALDVFGWSQAPSCSSTNSIVGILGLAAGLPLLVISLVPLWQMWIFRRWWKAPSKVVKVAIVGGGFAGLYAALGLNRLLGYHSQLEITVLDRKNYFLFPPLLPSTAAGTIETRQVTYPFRRVFETTNVIFRKAHVTRVDSASKKVIARSMDGVEGDLVQSYDYLVLAPGSLTQTFNTPGVADHALFMRELGDAIQVRNRVIDCFERAAASNPDSRESGILSFVVIGGGPTGVETATEIYDLIHKILLKRYPEIGAGETCVTLVQSGSQILPGWHPGLVRTTAKQLKKMGLKVSLDCRVASIGPDHVLCGNGDRIESRTVIWCAGVRPSELLKETGLELDKSGRVFVDADLRAKGTKDIFVLGDSALAIDQRTGRPLPPLGQVAFQQGEQTASNLVRLITGKQTVPFRYFDYGALVSVGEHFASVRLMGIHFSGFVAWFVWRTLYLAKIVGWSNKIRVVVDWTLDLLVERSISQIKD